MNTTAETSPETETTPQPATPQQDAVGAVPPELSGLTTAQLVELASCSENLEAIRAEVYQRLREDPRRANFLTFRWLFPADEADQADAFDGLIATCWRAVEKRQALNTWHWGHVEGTRDSIKNELIERLYSLKTLPVKDIIQTALDYGFQTDVDIANAVRRQVRWERNHRNWRLEVDDEEGPPILAILRDDADTVRANENNSVGEFMEQEKSRIIADVGETGWEVLWTFVDLVENDLIPDTPRERNRVLTEAIAAKRGVSQRQAREDKRRFREAFMAAIQAGNSVYREIAERLGFVETSAKLSERVMVHRRKKEGERD